MPDASKELDVGHAARRWWLELNRPSEQGGRDRASLAELKRSTDPLDVAFIPAFGRLRRHLEAYREWELQRAALIGHVLAHVREDDELAVARALGPRRQGGEGAAMNEARFRRLLQARDDDDLRRRLVRAVKLLRGRANVADLADAIWWWNDRTRQRWAFLYLDAEPPAKPDAGISRQGA